MPAKFNIDRGNSTESSTDANSSSSCPTFGATVDQCTVSAGPGTTIQSYTSSIRLDLEAAAATDATADAGAAAAAAASTVCAPSSSSSTGLSSIGFGVPADDDPDLYDPFCDPKSPKTIAFQDVSAAAYKIRNGVVRTPCDRSHMSRLSKADIYLKKEFLQFTGSFKERGARYSLLCLTQEQRNHGVVAASAGNHALALAYHGQQLSVPVVVVMPTTAPLMKISACVQYGARVVVMGNDMGEAKKIALKIAKVENLLYVNGYDHPQILSGQGTVGLEIIEQMQNVDAVIVPVGGGGLLAGIAVAVKTLSPDTLVIGAESERCASFSAAMKAGKPVPVPVRSSLADGLSVPLVGANAFYSCNKLVDKVVTVAEEFIALSILRLIELEKTVVEGAGATGLAAVLQGCLPELEGKRVAVVLCGGNIDTTVLGRVIDRGLAADGRLLQFVTTVSDRPGGIAEISAIMAGMGVSIKDIFHERAWLKADIFQATVRCVCEVRDREHGEELLAKLRDRYGYVKVN